MSCCWCNRLVYSMVYTERENNLSYDVAVIQWITSCHKNRMTTNVIIFLRVHVTSMTTSVSTIRFPIEIMLILKAIKSHFNGSYNKQNLTLVILSPNARFINSYE